MRRIYTFFFVLGALAFGASACGSADAPLAVELDQTSTLSDTGSSDAEADAAVEASSVPSAPTGPIAGPISVTSSFGLGLFTMDPDTGEVREFETTEVESVFDRSAAPAVTEDAAFILGATTRPDTDFSFDVGLVRIDRGTGELQAIADLGFDRENDDASDRNSFEIVGAAGDSVYVTIRDSAGETTWQRFDAETGAQVASFAEPRYDIADESGSCSGTVQPQVSVDGGLIGLLDDLPDMIDAQTGVIDSLPGGRSCSELSISLADVVSDPSELDAYSTYYQDVPVEWAGVDPFFWPDVTGSFAVNHGLVEGDSGDIWWVFNGSQSTENFEDLTPAQALLMGAVQYDPETATIANIFPLGEYAGEYLGVDDDGRMEISTPQFDLGWIDGRLVMVDQREDTPTLIFDPAAGTITEVAYSLGDGNDFVTAELDSSVPGELWVTVSRSVIVDQGDDGSRTSTSESFAERIDPATGEVIASFVWSDDGF